MTNIFRGRFTAQIDGPFVVFVIGMRVNKLMMIGKWLPVARAMRPMVEQGPGPAVGLIVLDREPNSLVAQALMDAAADAGRASP